MISGDLLKIGSFTILVSSHFSGKVLPAVAYMKPSGAPSRSAHQAEGSIRLFPSINLGGGLQWRLPSSPSLSLARVHIIPAWSTPPYKQLPDTLFQTPPTP